MDPYVGEIRLFAGNYAPLGWAFCNGALLSIQSNTALFSILGIQFGGDGKTNFALPDFRSRVPMHQGTGPGLTNRPFASTGGENTVTLAYNEMPAHTHAAKSVAAQTVKDPTQAIWANSGGRTGKSEYSPTPSVSMNSNALSVSGGSQPHNNAQPYVGLNFIIALEGVYPSKQ